MYASSHTCDMLHWWDSAGIHHVDLMIRRANGVTIIKRDITTQDIPLPWLKSENAHGSNIYLRPERGRAWPMVFLDDVKINMACRIARKYAALVIKTSTMGGCHLWLRTTYPLNEQERGHAQRWLAPKAGADRASVSGEHFGRLAGMRNWKRQGEWVNTIPLEIVDQPFWDPTPSLSPPEQMSNKQQYMSEKSTKRTNPTNRDQSASGKEWGWVCGMLEHGIDPETAFRRLYQNAVIRRDTDADRYSRLTIFRAIKQLL